MKSLIPGLLFVVLCGCTSRATDDISGQWIFTLEQDPWGNRGVPVECRIIQRRTDLALRCEGAAESMRGEVQGSTVTWRAEKTGIPPMLEDRLVVTYQGELLQGGTKITGVLRFASSVLDFSTPFEARKKS